MAIIEGWWRASRRSVRKRPIVAPRIGDRETCIDQEPDQVAGIARTTRWPNLGRRNDICHKTNTQSLKCGLKMKPTMLPSGVRTEAVTMPSPTSLAPACSKAPSAIAAETALGTSSTPQ